MSAWLPLTYRGYWDVPRIILVRRDDVLMLLDCQFDERLDEYPDDYTVHMMPPDFDEKSPPEDWTTLRDLAVLDLGTIPVAAVRFDARSRPQQIGAEVFDRLDARRPAPAPG